MWTRKYYFYIMNKVKVSVVSYSNTIPFIYGLEKSEDVQEKFNISRDIPSECAAKLLNDEVDIGLVPVAILNEMQEYHILSDTCISAYGKVASVMILSDVPIEMIDSLILDHHSRTSVNLAKILLNEYWNKEVKFLHGKDDFINDIKGNTAGVLIGDRCLLNKDKFTYQYDLAEEWRKHTGLPFVFAVWASKRKSTNT